MLIIVKIRLNLYLYARLVYRTPLIVTDQFFYYTHFRFIVWELKKSYLDSIIKVCAILHGNLWENLLLPKIWYRKPLLPFSEKNSGWVNPKRLCETIYILLCGFLV